MAIRHQITRRYATRNEEIVAGLLEAAGAGPPVDPMMLVKRKAAELSTAMALIHGGEWSAQIDHDFRLIVIRPA